MALAVLVALTACGSSERTPGPTREQTVGQRGGALTPTSPGSASEWARPRTPAPLPDEQPPPAPPIEIEETVELAPATTAPPAARHYGDELRAALGDVSGCLDAQTAARLGGALSVSVSATALPSGRLQRASVSAGGLPAPALACIRARVEAASLAPPIDGAPRSVSTTLRYSVSAELTVETRTRFATDERPPGDTQAPAVVLPALGPAGPAAGAQAPGVVLPALADPGPAPGAQAPAYTLPALSPPVP